MADEGPMQRVARQRRDTKEFLKQETVAEKEIAKLGEQYPSLRVQFAEIVYRRVKLKRYYSNQDVLSRMRDVIERETKTLPQSK